MNYVAACLYAVSSSTLLALALAFLRGGLNPSIAGTAISFGLLVASWTIWSGRHCTISRRPSGAWERVAIVAFSLVSLRIFLWLVFCEGDEIKVLSPNNLGDFSLHLTYIRFLANGVPFWPDNPIFTGGKLTYPVGVDLFHSLLVLLGANVFRAFIWIGLAGSALTGAALWRWGRGFALFGFLANGGLAALAIFPTGELADFQSPFAWKSCALALFATQRGMLYAFPAGLLLLSSWRCRLFGDEDDGWHLPLWGEVLLYASLPLFHFHTFLFLSLLLAWWFFVAPPAPRDWWLLVGPSFVPATVLVLLITGGLHGGHVLGWKAGWMWDDETFVQWCHDHFGDPARLHAAIIFWPLNFGVLPLFVAALVWKLLRGERFPWSRAVVFPALCFFLVCCFVKFAPWEWDNTKLMVWAYLALLPFLWQHLLAHRPMWQRGLACVALFGSGFLSTLGGIDQTHRGFPIASQRELDGVTQAVRAIPVADRFAGAPTYNHPLLLCGRKMVLGYLGHVASHGLAWEEPAGKLDTLMKGDEAWRSLAAELGARYLFWGRYEEETYPASTQPWRESARIIASGEWGKIYDLQSDAP